MFWLKYSKEDLCIMADDILAIELCNTAENIFSRLVFSDENDVM